MASPNVMVQVIEGDGTYVFQKATGPIVNPEIRWGETGSAVLHIGSRVRGMEPQDPPLESWLQKAGEPAKCGDVHTDPTYPLRSAVVQGAGDYVIVEVSSYSQPFTIRIMDRHSLDRAKF